MLTNRRRNALAFCSSLAIATALAAVPQAAGAQSFQGSSTVVAGGATVTTGSNTTTVDVTTSQAVINWNPFDTATNPGVPIDFQPAGTVATFQSSGDFAVLNRILPTDASRPVQFNGTVISQLQGASTTPGGTVYFYSPGGVIVGSSAVFNVGNLGLTTSDPLVDGNGNWYNSVSTPIAGQQVQFGQAASGSSVQIQPGAQIDALTQGSYIAVFSPYIEQNGTVTVNGLAEYVAAEAGTLTFNPFAGFGTGLMDIEVSIGSDGQNGVGISHGGTTTGPASTGTTDLHRIYMVAIPKNSLLAIGIERGSSIGFDIAGAANVDGNAVVLSAGENLRGDAYKQSSRVAGGDIRVNDSNTGLSGTGIDFTSKVIGQATNEMTVDVFRQTNFASDAFFGGEKLTQVAVGAIPNDSTGSLTVGGKLWLQSDFGLTTPASADAAPARFIVDGGSANVSGDLLVQSIATTDRNGDGVVTAGLAEMILSNGQLSVGGLLQVIAPALGNGGGGLTSAQGGSARITLLGASTLSASGDLDVGASAATDGGSTALDAAAGDAQVELFGSSQANVAGVTRIKSEGISALGANAAGGYSLLLVAEGSQFTTNELNISSDADGLAGGPTAAPGTAQGGSAYISVGGANSVLTVQSGNSTGDPNVGELDLLSAEAFAGASNASGGTGGSALGGAAGITLTDGGVINLPANPGTAGNVRILARAYGGKTFATGGTGGTATGGTVDLFVSEGTLNGGNTMLPSSFALGGSADASVTGAANGGDAFGGARNVTVINGAINGSFSGGGPGAQGGDGSLAGTGGSGTGGTANFFMDNGQIIATTDAFGISRVISFVQNAGGAGAFGGSASGGINNVTIQNGSVINMMPDSGGAGGIVNFNSFNTTPELTGAGAIASGDATAGSVSVSISNSQITAAEFDIYADAQTGGIATLAGAGANAHTGNATGGFAYVNLDGATINVDTMVVEAAGSAGDSEDAGTVDGGSGTGGSAQIFANGAPSTITVNELDVDASGTGGTIFGGPGNGGNGTGGYALIHAFDGGALTVTGSTYVSAGGDAHSAQVQGRGGEGASGFAEVSTIGGSLTFNNLDISTTAEGGDGTVAGNASALVQTDRPNSLIFARNGSVTVSGVTTIGSESFGGAGFAGGNGGNANGGFVAVNADNDLSGPSTISLQTLFMSTNAYGGTGGTGVSGGTGGAGGDAVGGDTEAFAGAGNGTLTVAGQTYLNAGALGGTGGEGGGGVNGGTGGAGGPGTGGSVLFGTLSRADTGTVNDGSASFIDVFAVSDANGGDGGAGGIGSSTNGNGGAGGFAQGGSSILLVRGSTVTSTGSVNLYADAFGGTGGTGAVQGVGGNSRVGGDGGVAIIVSSRFQQPTQRGFLDAADIFGIAQAFGGDGSTPGSSVVADSPISIDIADGDVTAHSLALIASADFYTFTARPSFLTVANGRLDIANSLAMSTNGDLSVSLDNSQVNTAYLSLAAGNFVLPEVKPTTLGTFHVLSGLETSSETDFLAYANFVTPFDISFNVNGSFLTGDLIADGLINVSALGSVTAGLVDANGVVLVAGEGVNTLGIRSDSAIIVAAGSGPATLGDLTAGGTTPGLGKIAIGSSTGVTAGAIRSTGDLGIQSGGSISTGDLIGRDVLLLAGNSLTTGSILAVNGTQPNGAIYFGNSSMATSDVNVFQQFRSSAYPEGVLPIFQQAPVAIGGSATFGGPIQGGTLTGAALGALTAGAVTAANFIQLESGGLVSVNGAWRSPDIEIVSNDIAIGSNGSLDALSVEGTIDLASTNSAGVTVGDGAGTSGYSLDNSEFGRIKAGQILVVGTDGSQATDMTIGNLAITGSQLYGDGGSVTFATGDRSTETPGGIVRIAGAVSATGFGAANEIDLLAGTVELEAVHGSLKVSDASGNLGGLVYIEADGIHVASNDILTKLRADPFYEGHITDLNTPLTVTRPDGVLNALGLELDFTQTLYVQNTGTVATPAGFLTTLDNSEVDGPDDPNGNVEAVINGQFQTDTGVVTGADAFNLVQEGADTEQYDFEGFSEGSQLNGCAFSTGTCTAVVTSDPVASLSSVISVVTNAALDDSPTAPAAEDSDEGDDGSSDDKDEDSDSDTGASPIAVPPPLINTRQLNPNVDVVEPVAGAGNPALLGSAVDEGITEGETP